MVSVASKNLKHSCQEGILISEKHVILPETCEHFFTKHESEVRIGGETYQIDHVFDDVRPFKVLSFKPELNFEGTHSNVRPICLPDKDDYSFEPCSQEMAENEFCTKGVCASPKWFIDQLGPSVVLVGVQKEKCLNEEEIIFTRISSVNKTVLENKLRVSFLPLKPRGSNLNQQSPSLG